MACNLGGPLGDFNERGDRTNDKVIRRTEIWETGLDATGKRPPVVWPEQCNSKKASPVRDVWSNG